ncbi:MAG: hypothetical protein K0R50_4570 [Eubacterium sp.]|jgi:hypothetical protein|nr:hypothetical protein [Eubacterium sp.]
MYIYYYTQKVCKNRKPFEYNKEEIDVPYLYMWQIPLWFSVGEHISRLVETRLWLENFLQPKNFLFNLCVIMTEQDNSTAFRRFAVCCGLCYKMTTK